MVVYENPLLALAIGYLEIIVVLALITAALLYVVRWWVKP